MKKLAILAALMVASLQAFGDGAITLNNFDANNGNGFPIYVLTSGTVAKAGQVQVEILAGPTGGALSDILNTAGTAITSIAMGAGGAGDGYFDAGIGVVPGGGAPTAADFQLRAWVGAAGSTYNGATVRGSTATWNQPVGSFTLNASPPDSGAGAKAFLPTGSLLLTQVAVPEPSTVALGLLGGLALLIRRKK